MRNYRFNLTAVLITTVFAYPYQFCCHRSIFTCKLWCGGTADHRSLVDYVSSPTSLSTAQRKRGHYRLLPVCHSVHSLWLQQRARIGIALYCVWPHSSLDELAWSQFLNGSCRATGPDHGILHSCRRSVTHILITPLSSVRST